MRKVTVLIGSVLWCASLSVAWYLGRWDGDERKAQLREQQSSDLLQMNSMGPLAAKGNPNQLNVDPKLRDAIDQGEFDKFRALYERLPLTDSEVVATQWSWEGKIVAVRVFTRNRILYLSRSNGEWGIEAIQFALGNGGIK